MSRYQYKTSYHHKRVQARKTRVAAIFAVSFIMVLVGFIVYDKIRDVIDNEKPESSTVVSAVEGATINLFTTPYFQFQADKTWVEVPEVSTESKFVYKSKNGPIVQHQLVVYVGEPPANEVIGTRVYPVEVTGDGHFRANGPVSEHCRKGVDEKAKNEPQQVTYQQVTFKCDVGNTIYRVLVGLVDGTPTIPMPRPDGSTQRYTIIYDDVTATPNSNKIDSIVSTFRTR